jgi:hypothetical protein
MMLRLISLKEEVALDKRGRKYQFRPDTLSQRQDGAEVFSCSDEKISTVWQPSWVSFLPDCLKVH